MCISSLSTPSQPRTSRLCRHRRRHPPRTHEFQPGCERALRGHPGAEGSLGPEEEPRGPRAGAVGAALLRAAGAGQHRMLLYAVVCMCACGWLLYVAGLLQINILHLVVTGSAASAYFGGTKTTKFCLTFFGGISCEIRVYIKNGNTVQPFF